MRPCRLLVIVVCCALSGLRIASAGVQEVRKAPQVSTERLQQEFFSDFDISAASSDADQLLRRQPGDVIALFIRMETAVLQQRTDAVLDSALRLCTMPAPQQVQEIASSRVLENAANSRVFRDVLRRVGLAMGENNACTFNLRLALVAAAADGITGLDLDKTADSAGLLTRWRIAGPFGHFSNVDFERQWPPETDPFWSRSSFEMESFWFHNGMTSLPDYLSGPGVFYAVSNVRTGAEQSSQIDVLSPGPYVLYVDGKQVLVRDSRYAATGNRASLALRLTPGQHRIIVKFTADAAPFSVDLHPAFVRHFPQAEFPLPHALAEYVQALLEYFRGDFSAVERRLFFQARDHGPFLYLRALLWSATEDHSPRARAAWDGLTKEPHRAVLARIRAAEYDIESKPDDMREEIADLERRRPESEAAAQLVLNAAHGDKSAKAEAFRRLLELHPTCARLADAMKFFNSIGDQAGAGTVEQEIPRCAPESLDYITGLSEAGQHKEAAILLEQKLARDSLNRVARRMLIQELVLSGDLEKAQKQARELHRIAPGNAAFAHLVADPAAVLDSHSPRSADFARQAEFYTPYRRDGSEAARKAKPQALAGVAAIVLLSDRVLQIGPDGTASLYSHRVTRLVTKEGITRHGEVVLPRGIDLLELRTIKANGQVIEPELIQQKSSISMPALEPGDDIEEEFVEHYPDWRHLPSSASQFEFASFTVPVISSHLVVLEPKTAAINIEIQNGAPLPSIEVRGNQIVRSWVIEGMPAMAAEPFAPASGLLATVNVAPGENTLDRLRDVLIDSTRIGPHAIQAYLEQSLGDGISDREKARRLYRFVTSRIESTGPDLAAASAEDTLAAGEGGRTAALLALTHAAGLKSALLLARKIDQRCTPNRPLDCYTEPLVRFWVGGEVIDADAEADDLAFGAVSPGLDPRSALLVPVSTPAAGNGDNPTELVALAIRPAGQQSVAEGDLFLDTKGNLTATIQVRLGVARAQQVRAVLRSANASERQTQFEQLAARIFPGATDVHGEPQYLAEPDQPLQLKLSCSVPQFITMQPGPKEIGQMAPSLGLRTDFSKNAGRHFPLLLDSVFFENTVFHLHLPPGVAVRSLPQDFVARSEFGQYTVRFRQSGQQVDVIRQFEIPAQVVKPERFSLFMEFARQIAEAEHQRITLELRRATVDAQSEPSQFATR